MRLSAFILENLEPILVEWEEFARSLEPGRRMTVHALRDDAERMLKFVAADIDSTQSSAEQHEKSVGRGPQLPAGVSSAAHAHGKGRALDHFTFAEMVSEYRALRAAVTRMWLRTAPLDYESVIQLVRFNEAIDQVLAESVVLFAATLEREVDLFTASIAHDLRSPLNAVVTGTQLLSRSTALSKTEGDTARRALKSANSMAAMLSDLQDFSRGRLGALIELMLEDTDVASICREVIAEIALAHPTLAFKFDEFGDTVATVDCRRIRQLVSNLVGNAVQHGSQNGTIAVQVQGTPENVRIEVHNSGPGIAESHLADIFEPMRRLGSASGRQHQGLGLGLYIVRRVALAHGGHIKVQSSDVGGTTFTVTLPKTNNSQAALGSADDG